MSMKITATYLHPNIKAFLQTIQFTEGTYKYNDPYSVLFGGGKFTDFSTHPNQRIPFHNPQKAGSGNNDYSTASGAYQINKGTYDSLNRWSFDPESQDLDGVDLLKRRGIYNDIVNDNIDAVLNNPQTGLEWASMPSSRYGQPTKSYSKTLSVYQAAKGAGKDTLSSLDLNVELAKLFVSKNKVPIVIGATILTMAYAYFVIRKINKAA